jgi:hypothetical protein
MRVVIESPLKGRGATVEYRAKDETENRAYAKACVRDSLARGEAPFASHLLYAQEGILDDAIPEERAKGIQAGFEWGEAATLVAVYEDRGITVGMEAGIARARAHGQAVVFRRLDGTETCGDTARRAGI